MCYQETFSDRAIDLEEFYESAKKGGRFSIVSILYCSEQENIRRLSHRSSGSKTKLNDVAILEHIRRDHFVYSFYGSGFNSSAVWEYHLDIENMLPQDAASKILNLIEKHTKVYFGLDKCL